MAGTPTDPFALFRSLLGEWEKTVNQHGADLLAKPEVAQALQQATSAKLQMQAASEVAVAFLELRDEGGHFRGVLQIGSE